MQDRINQLENLVITLMQQGGASPRSPLSDHPPPVTPDDSSPGQAIPPPGTQHQLCEATAGPEGLHDVPPSPSDYGSIRIRESGVSFVGSAHWAAVLDRITELRDHFEKEDEARARSSDPPVHLQGHLLSPQLLYGCSMHTSLTSILDAVPPRSAVDRLVARYFNDLDMAAGKSC